MSWGNSRSWSRHRRYAFSPSSRFQGCTVEQQVCSAIPDEVEGGAPVPNSQAGGKTLKSVRKLKVGGLCAHDRISNTLFTALVEDRRACCCCAERKPL